MIDFGQVPTDPADPTDPGGGTPTPTPEPAPESYEWQQPYELPKWMTGAQKWTDWGHISGKVNPSDVKQDWYRDPSWGGHIVFNPFYGWQDYKNVEKLYETAGGPVSWQDFKEWGLDKQHSTDWRKFYDEKDYPVRGGQYWPGGEETSTTQSEFDWQDWFRKMLGGAGYGSSPTAQPEQSNVFDWQTPLQSGINVMSQFAESGMPVDYQGWWDAKQPVMQRTIEDQAKQSAEQFGLGGLRYSTPLQRNITDITGRETNKAWSDFMGMSLGGQEAARERARQAAGALPGMSQAGYGMQSDIARNLISGGQTATGFNQQQLGNLFNIFNQNNPTLNTWLQSALGGLGMSGDWMNQQYSPSGLSQFFMGLGNMMPGFSIGL